MDAYIFAVEATPQAVTDALALVPGTARAALPMPDEDRELYVAVSDSNAIELLTKIADVVTIEGLSSPSVYLAYGSSSEESTFPTYGVVNSYVGFALLVTAPTSTVSVYEAAQGVSGVVGAAMVAGSASVLVEATAASSTALTTVLGTVTGLSNVLSSVTSQGPVSGGAGFTTA